MELIFYVAALLIGGLVMARILGLLKFPDVTGYLIAGILIGPSVLKIIPQSGVDSLEIISQVALSFIAFSVGSEMNINSIKKIGSKILLVTIFEALGAFLMVTLAMMLIFKTDFAFALTIGSIASATAPAATLMVIRQYQARGELVDVLVPVVALDDAVCIMAFGVASSIATSMLSGAALNITNMLLIPLKEIFLAIIIGFISAILYILISKKLKNDEETLIFTLAVVLGLTALTLKLNISGLLTLMVTGIVIANMGKVSRRYQQLINQITPPIFVCFFVLSGADLSIDGLTHVGLIGIGYVIFRVIGKMGAAYISTRITGFSKEVQNNLGLTLVPQAGVAIGLSLIASNIIPDPHGAMIRTIILGATIIYELIGPMVAKIALKRAGCIK